MCLYSLWHCLFEAFRTLPQRRGSSEWKWKESHCRYKLIWNSYTLESQIKIFLKLEIINLYHILGPSNGVTEKAESQDKNGRLYDKAGKIRKIKHENKEADGEG